MTTYTQVLQPGDSMGITAAIAAPPPPPPPSTPWSVPFLGRTPSSALVISNRNGGPPISGLQFQGLSGVALILQNCQNLTVTANDFDTCVGGIFTLNCQNITLTWNRFHEIGGSSTVGSGKNNLIQLNNTTGAYIGNNKGIGGRTEDMFSIYMSSGADAAHPIIVENNALEGTDWTSSSGSGVMIGDAGGSHIVVRKNTVLTPGQVGIGIVGGADNHVVNNVLYDVRRVNDNVGLSCYNPSGSNPFGPHEISGNRVFWLDANGNPNPIWIGAGTVTQTPPNVLQDPTINPALLHVTL